MTKLHVSHQALRQTLQKKKLKWTFKNCQATSFLKPLLQFVSIFKFVQPCLQLYLLCLLNILSMFWAVNFMFRSVCFQFSLLACSRLRDSRARRIEKARRRKINGRKLGRGERLPFHFFPPRPHFRAPYTFASSPLFRAFSTIWQPGTGYSHCLNFDTFRDPAPLNSSTE